MVEKKEETVVKAATARVATPGPLAWDKIGERFYETGVSKGVLFPMANDGTYESGVAWSGLTKITKSPEGGEETALYADDIKYLSLYSVEELKGTIEAYTYPDEFAVCDGSAEVGPGVTFQQQTRKPFALAWVNRIGNDIEGATHSYKINLVYGVRVSPSEKASETINETPGAQTFSWAFSATKQDAGDMKFLPTASVEIDVRTAPAEKVKELEALIFGSESKAASMPTLAAIVTMFKGA
jgi:hypothetical protein